MRYVPFSAHADAKGILQLVQQVAPHAVMLVHGEPDKMAFMSNKIKTSLNIPCYMPANGEEVVVSTKVCGLLQPCSHHLASLLLAMYWPAYPG